MRNLILMVALVAACGSDTSTGVGGQDAELHCRAWCDGGCGTGRTPEECRSDCRWALAEPCGEHVKAEHDCMTALQCSDPFEDCDHHQSEHSQCRTELAEYCDQCEPTPETPENEAACYRYTGECGGDIETTRCEFYVRAGRCSNMELCLMHGPNTTNCMQ